MKTGVIGPFPPYRGGIAQFSMRLLETLISGFPEHDFVPVSYRRLYPSILFPGTSQLEPDKNTVHDNTQRLIDSCNPFNWMSSRNYLSHSGFDSLIVQWWHPFFAPALLASIPRSIPRTAVCHNVIPHESFPFAGKLSRNFLNSMDLVVVHSETDFQAAETLDLNAGLLKLYHPLYDQYNNPEVTRENSRKKLGYSEKARLVLFFGLIRSYKGVLDLVRSMNFLPDNISLLIAGECYSDRHEITSSISSLNLTSRIRWIDKFVPDSDVATYFNAADVVALPYRSASQSGVAQIALSFGKVLVLTDTGGLAELVDQGSTGVLAQAWSPSSIAESILTAFELQSNPETKYRIRAKASSFSWEAYVEKLMEKIQ